MSTVLLFVYGTLKQGFPNHARNPGRRVGGTFRTRHAYPLYVVELPNEDRAPWLVASPGQGQRVRGEVYEVDGATLAAMDVFEEVGLPGGYERAEIELEAVDGPPGTVRAQAYLKPERDLAACLARDGPFEEYTLDLAQGYWLVLPAAPGSA